MSLNVILGKSNSGKTEYIMHKIMACENNKKQAILFVPPSARIIAEEEYLKYTEKKALISTIVTSIERFVNRNVNKIQLYKDKTYLKELAKKMMVKKVISENPEIFKVFSKVKDTVGFTDKIIDYVERFEDLQELDDLDKYTETDFLKAKLDEFKSIYLKLEEKLKDRFVQATDEMKEYITCLTESNTNIVNADIFIDNYNNFNEMEYQFIQALLLSGNDVYISLDIDKNKYLSEITDIYDTSYDTLTRLKEICVNSGIAYQVINLEKSKDNTKQDIKFLANNIWDTSKNTYNYKVQNVNLVLTPNMIEEIKYIAENILKGKKEGYSYKDMAVYTNNISMYNIYIKKLFGLYNIPMYINEQDSIIINSLVVYLKTILKIVKCGFTKNIDSVISLIKTGMLDITEQEGYAFENYTLEFGIKGYNLQDAFKFNGEYDLDAVNGVREKIVQLVSKLKTNLNNKSNSKDITEVIYNHLIESRVIQRYEQRLDNIKAIDNNEYNKAKQVLPKIYDIMDNISIAYQEITLSEYIELLDYGFKQVKVDTVPEKVEQVEIIDINKSRGTEKKIGYIIGCYDGGLPSVQVEDNIFTDIELEKLKSVGIDLRQTSNDRNNMQLFNIYQAINKVRDRLVITVPASSNLGTSLRPSSFIQEVKRVLNISLESAENTSYLNMNEAFMKFMSKLKDVDDDTDRQAIEEMYINYILFKHIPKYSEIMSYSRKDNNLEQKTLDNIYDKKINSSISRLEQFKRCPFAYYTKYILNLKERKEYVMSTLDTGSFMHEIIEKISKYIISKNIAWQDIVLDERIKEVVNIKIEELVDKLFEEEYSKYLTSGRYVVFKLKMKKAMKRTIFAIADSFNHSEFRPLGYEIQFEKDSLFAPIQIDLENGKTLFLRGKIDRVDSLDIDGNTYLRIVDYKSSDKNLKLSDVKSGISLQLMTYMCAMLENTEKVGAKNVIPAALSYFTISNKILSIPNYEQNENKIAEKLKKELKLKGIYINDIEILKKLDNNIENSKESYLEISKRTLENKEKALPEEIFIQECKNVKQILKDIGKEIVKGYVKIEPNKNINGVCEYCNYASVCRKNMLN